MVINHSFYTIKLLPSVDKTYPMKLRVDFLKPMLLLGFTFLSLSLWAKEDTIVVNTYDYTLYDYWDKPKSLHKKDRPNEVLNGQFKVLKTNSWHEDLFIKDNLVEGKNYIYYINRCIEERHYAKGELDGKQLTYYDRSKQPYKVATYKNGHLVNASFSYYEDGSVWTMTPYKDGKKNGMYYSYYHNRQIERSGAYKEDKKVGKWVEYYKNKHLKSVERYTQTGSFIFEQTYYPSGKKNLTKHLDNRIYVGTYERFYDDGQLVFSFHYKNGYKRGKQREIGRYNSSDQNNIDQYQINKRGQLHGVYLKRIQQNKVILVKGHFKNGLRSGQWMHYTPDGKVFRKEVYKKGKRLLLTDTPIEQTDVQNPPQHIAYDENFHYTIPNENPHPNEKQLVEEMPFFLFGE